MIPKQSAWVRSPGLNKSQDERQEETSTPTGDELSVFGSRGSSLVSAKLPPTTRTPIGSPTPKPPTPSATRSPLSAAIKSPFGETKSPFEQKSPFDQPKSPFDQPKSPFEQPKSPFEPQKSPFEPQKSPFEPQKSPFEPQKSPFEGKITSPTRSPTTVVLSSEPFSSQTPTSKEMTSRCVWVGNVSQEITEQQFRKYFEEFGEVELIRMFPRSKCAFVTFKTKEAAVASRELEGKMVGNLCLTLNIGKASRHLWVGNIGPHVTELDLRTAFEKFGTVESVRVLRGNKCAFVNFASETEAMKALEDMNGKSLGNQRIVINFQWEHTVKRPGRLRAPDSPFGKGSKYPAGLARSFEIPSRQLFVGSIVPSVTDGILWHLFSKFGEVEQIKGYANRGYAFVVFRSLQVAVWVREQMKLYPPTIGGRPLVVNFGRQPTSNPGSDDYPYPLPGAQPIHVPAPMLPTSHQPIASTLPPHVPGSSVSMTPPYYPTSHSMTLPHPTLPGYVMATIPQSTESLGMDTPTSTGSMLPTGSYDLDGRGLGALSSPSSASLERLHSSLLLSSVFSAPSTGTPSTQSLSQPTSSLSPLSLPLPLQFVHSSSTQPSYSSTTGFQTTSTPFSSTFPTTTTTSFPGTTSFTSTASFPTTTSFPTSTTFAPRVASYFPESSYSSYGMDMHSRSPSLSLGLGLLGFGLGQQTEQPPKQGVAQTTASTGPFTATDSSFSRPRSDFTSSDPLNLISSLSSLHVTEHQDSLSSPYASLLSSSPAPSPTASALRFNALNSPRLGAVPDNPSPRVEGDTTRSEETSSTTSRQPFFPLSSLRQSSTSL